jgi:DNA-binding CsgD family transcriptional regulator/tetratricopeptide (TPR) repeat protein
VEAKRLLDESLRLYQQADDPKGIADSLYVLGRVAWSLGDYLTAQSSHEAALARQISLANQWDVAMSHYALGLVALFQGDLPGARRRIESALALFQAMGSQLGVTIVEVWRGWITAYEGDLAAARETLSHCLAFGKKAGGPRTIIFSLVGLGDIARREGDLEAARAYYEEGLTTGGDRQFVAFSLEGLGMVAVSQERFVEAARWFGAADSLRQAKAMPLPPFRQAAYKRNLELVRTQLDPAAFHSAWAEGPQLYGHLIEEPKPVGSALPDSGQSPLPEPLTPRELDVLRLVAQGLTNAQVGEQLVISPRTVDAHLRSIYGKLDVTSRAAATRFALEHQLV